MRVWVVLRGAANLRFVVPILAALEQRGHTAVISLATPPTTDEERRALEAARAELPRLELEDLDLADGSSFWSWYARRILAPARELRSYLTQSPYWGTVLRDRWRAFLPRPLRALVRVMWRAPYARLRGNQAALWVLQRLEDAYPEPRGLVRQLRRIGPGLVLVSPMIYPLSREIDAVRTALREGVACSGLVLSWDNLSSKGSFHAVPDSVLVWNEVQRRETAMYHGLDDGRVDVVGAPVFDYLFSDELRRERSDVLHQLSLEPDRHYVLYAVSSEIGLGAGREVEIALRLAATLRTEFGTDAPALVVRPHPKNSSGWTAVGNSDIRIVPAAFPDSHDERASLYNAIAHALAVVGLNTTMFVEAAILDLPCVSMRFKSGDAPAITSSFVHFTYLLDGGFLHVVEDERTAAAVVRRIAAEGDPLAGERRAFVRRFVRPCGLERAAADVAAESLIATARGRT